MGKTQLVVKLATEETIPVQSHFDEAPPTIVIEFPAGRVTGMLPERSAIQRGVIEEIHVSYGATAKPVETRWIQSMRIQLRGPYRHALRVEPGRIVIDIEHPQAVRGQDVEVGLRGGILVAGAIPPTASARFSAMQEALEKARPQRWIWQARSEPQEEPQTESDRTVPVESIPSAASQAAPSGVLEASQGLGRWMNLWTMWLWVIAGLGLAVVGGLWLWWHRLVFVGKRRVALGEPSTRMRAGIQIIDQLVWRAFERQGYQLLHTVEVRQPYGLMRLMAKEGIKAALLCVGDGAFFEKTTVERFIEAMQKTQAEQGFLVAPGSFTVPAQRCAKERGVALIGRDQLMELLSEGAMSEHYAKQLKQLRGGLDEAKETLNEYAKQLEVIRRQRNEASWLLGEERAKTAKIQTQLAELNQQLLHWQAEVEQWQQTASQTQKQWEESQWYLGEARACAQHLEGQLKSLNETFGQLEERRGEAMAKLQETERQRDEANWYLGESRVALEASRQQVQQREEQLRQVQDALGSLRQALEENRQLLEAERRLRRMYEIELDALRIHGERRRSARAIRSDVTVVVQRPTGEIMFEGIPANVSIGGLGLLATGPIDLADSLQILLKLPGLEQPIESTGRFVWQRQDPITHQYSVGCELIDLPAQAREAVERSIASSN